MVNRIYLLLLALVIGNNSSFAGEEIGIDRKAPEGMESLETEISIHDDVPENKGDHGYRGYCYKKDAYIVYSYNLLGSGYIISERRPKDHKCTETNREILAANKLGIRLGMKKKVVENLIGVNGVSDSKSVIWLSDVYYNGQRFYLQTYAEFGFENGELVWLSVFTTETN